MEDSLQASPPKSTPEILVDSDTRLLETAHRLQQLFGSEVWPSFETFTTQVVFVTDRGQVLLNSSNAPTYYLPYEGPVPTWAKKKALYTRERRGPEGSIYTQEKFDTDYIASAYSSSQTKRHFSNSVFFVDSIERFHKKGWKWSVEDWMAIYWHEVFHDFQDTLYKADLVSDSVTDFKPVEDLINDDAYRNEISKEQKLLSEALKVSSPSDKHRIICKEFLPLREARYAFLRKSGKASSIATEQFYEISEGTARYVEELLTIAVANAPSNSRNEFSLISALPHFDGFRKFKGRTKRRYFDRILNLPKGERYFYQTGFALALVLDQVMPDWKNSAFKSKEFLFGRVKAYCQ